MNHARTKSNGRFDGGRSFTKIGSVAIPVIVVLALVFAARPGPSRSDDQRIRDALNDGAQAVQRHDIPALMQIVSKDYKDDTGMNRDRIRFLLAQVFRDHYRIWVDLGNPAVQVEGKNATVTTDATVEVLDKGMPESERATHSITIRFRKEPGRRFLLFPIDRWKIVEAQGSGLSDESDSFGL